MIEIKRILCAIDFSEATPKVAEYAKAMARRFQAKLLVLYVAPTMNRYAMFHVQVQQIQGFVESIIQGAKERMEQYVPEAFGDVDAEGLVDNGDAAEAILRTIGEEDIDLVVMGTHGRKGIDRIIFGSVAERVVQGSAAPVLTVRP